MGENFYTLTVYGFLHETMNSFPALSRVRTVLTKNNSQSINQISFTPFF